MSRDESSNFRPRLGRARERAHAGHRVQSFVNQVKAAASAATGTPLGQARVRKQRTRTNDRARARKGRCCRIGRGQAAADRLKLMAGTRGRSGRMRRVIVKARIVRLKASSRAADAHIRYLQRDGTTRDGEHGRIYGAETDAADGKAFIERGREDRHQFRFIVAPEDGEKLSDLRAFTRDVIRQMEKDLGTGLDWIAVDHFNTGHPHTHVIVRGRDDLAKDLIIAQDYITDGMRLRAQELATLELGPETDRELRAKLQAEISTERLTRIDRAMIAEAKEQVLDLRPEAGQVRADFDRTLRIDRLQTLARFGLAEETEPGVWNLSNDLESTMRRLGERGDIVKAMSRALARRGHERAVECFDLHGEEARIPIIGRLIDKRLSDELGEQIGLVIDGIDGKVHHVALAAPQPMGTTRSAPLSRSEAPSRHPADRNIARWRAVSASIARAHRALAEAQRSRSQGGDYDAYVNAHVRRLEALRRGGIVERLDTNRWRILTTSSGGPRATMPPRDRGSACAFFPPTISIDRSRATALTWRSRVRQARPHGRSPRMASAPRCAKHSTIGN